jgi:hypothetical protein
MPRNVAMARASANEGPQGLHKRMHRCVLGGVGRWRRQCSGTPLVQRSSPSWRQSRWMHSQLAAACLEPHVKRLRRTDRSVGEGAFTLHARIWPRLSRLSIGSSLFSACHRTLV